ncbi:RpiB/LacA/LacB family sugar-phosphate isomerase [Streptomyces sp. CBMA152]|uniref:RpiB/LacA/LacB family sugar-phosphate isomerase n=1 Tax=Streptomyces sp. CBMA152 TaxID=1896312 RepID=UPI0016615B86|nr:RpiB/LacA/LacB family sugar-phosphate isomerase [Streptomyces sp. CBMA152]MBD0742971.1 D-erythrulose-4-phosphate isomerase 1 [Streptomyces sp. CBMA152]
MKPLRIAIGSDMAGLRYKAALAEDLRASRQVVSVIGVADDMSAEPAYPDVAFAAARLVARGSADRALLICHTGLGMAIAANKVWGIRAVTARDSLSVQHAVLSNDAQVLALGQGVIGLDDARLLVQEWLSYRFDPASSAARKVEAITAYEHRAHDAAMRGL